MRYLSINPRNRLPVLSRTGAGKPDGTSAAVRLPIQFTRSVGVMLCPLLAAWWLSLLYRSLAPLDRRALHGLLHRPAFFQARPFDYTGLSLWLLLRQSLRDTKTIDESACDRSAGRGSGY